MRTRGLVLLVLLVVTLASRLGAAAVQEAAPPGPVELSEEMRALLDQAVQEGRAVPPEQAIEAVRQFAGVPDLPVAVTYFRDDPVLISIECCFYGLEDTASGTSYDVRAADGKVFRWHWDAETPAGAAAITPEQAMAVAEQYARERYQNFDALTWVAGWDGGEDAGLDYAVRWCQVLNEHGVRAPYRLSVHVHPFSGKVTGFATPPERITGPTVPQVTEQQARAIARAVAPMDPDQVPFTEVQLELTEDRLGLQHLCWELWQRVPPPPDRRPLCRMTP